MKENKTIKQKKSSGKTKVSKRLLMFLVIAFIACGAGAYAYLHGLAGSGGGAGTAAGTYTVQRSDLTVSVIENGDLKPLNSLVIKSKVEKNSTTIISIVDEGTYITPEDVNNGMILVELDRSEIKQEVMEEEIKFLDGKADMTTAKEAYDIQLIQNESDIEAGKIMVRFGMMDLQKYLGASVAKKVLASAEDSNSWQDNVSMFIDDPNLGGEALQMIRELNSTITLNQAKLARARDKLKGTQELYDSNYAAEIELQGDKEQDQTARALYLKYEFSKQVVTLLSAYHEALRELDKIHAKARSELAKARGEHDKEKAKFVLQEEELNHVRKQLDFCTIRAPAPGDVVYASSMISSSSRRRSRTIELGASISERQSIISIPDPSVMKVEIKIHETWIDKIKIGQKVRINVTAFREETLTGEVIKKAPMADPEEWMNPDLKVYSTDIRIDGTHESLKTGMTAMVEVIIEELKDVISVPIQTVVNVEGKKICYVASATGTQQREVETGSFNDDFVEIKSGLSEGERVLLNPPRVVESEATQQ